MLQVERLNVVNKTLKTLLAEVKEGKIEDHREMSKIGHDIFETILTINEQITLNRLNQLKPSDESEVPHEDS